MCAESLLRARKRLKIAMSAKDFVCQINVCSMCFGEFIQFSTGVVLQTEFLSVSKFQTSIPCGLECFMPRDVLTFLSVRRTCRVSKFRRSWYEACGELGILRRHPPDTNSNKASGNLLGFDRPVWAKRAHGHIGVRVSKPIGPGASVEP